jgi:hypothetical protein
VQAKNVVFVTRHETEADDLKWRGVNASSKNLVLMGERMDKTVVQQKLNITPAVPTGHEVVRCIYVVGSGKTFNCPKNGNPDHSCLQVLMPDINGENSNDPNQELCLWKRQPVLKQVINQH